MAVCEASLAVKSEHLLENRYRQFGAYLLFVTVRDAYEISRYRQNKKYKRDFKDRFGFRPQGSVEDKYQRVAERLDAWIASDDCFVIIKKLGLDPDRVKTFIRDLLKGERLDEMEAQLEQLEGEIHRYVWNEEKNKNRRNKAS